MKKLIAVLLMLTLAVCVMLPTIGCTNTQVTTAVSKIANYIPAVISLNSVVSGAVVALDPKDAQLVLGITGTVNDGLKQLQALCAAYTANPNATAWQNIIALVDSVVVNGDAALLQASRISNPQSKMAVTAALGALDAGLHIIDGFVLQTQPKAAVQQKAANRQIKLDQVARYWSERDRAEVATRFNTDFDTAYKTATTLGF